MFDLTKKLPEVEASKPVQPASSGPTGCALIYQTQECRSLVEELFEFEGWDAPNSIDNRNVDSQFYAKQDSNLIIVELNESQSVVEDAQAIAATLPTHKGVVIIGQEDAISTLRSLKGMGFYYVFWPINKYEFAEFVMHVNNDLKSYSGVSKERRAKRVAVVGSKGGIGTSYIATELSSKMADDGVDTILVDHQYHDSNIDVLLGLTNHAPRALDEFSVPLHELDLEGAMNYLHPVSRDLRLLSLQGDALEADLLAYNQALCELLSRNTNFIVEDFSGSVDFQVDCKMLIDHYDVVAIVVEPSVAAVRKAKALISSLDAFRESTHKRTRIITVVNHHRPDKSFVIERDEIEKYLGSSVDLDFDYCKNLPHLHVDGKRAYKHDRHVSQAINKLVHLVNGRSANKSKGLLQRLGIR